LVRQHGKRAAYLPSQPNLSANLGVFSSPFLMQLNQIGIANLDKAMCHRTSAGEVTSCKKQDIHCRASFAQST